MSDKKNAKIKSTTKPGPLHGADRGRIFGLDLVRAAAISCVLIGHYGVILPAWGGVEPMYGIALLAMIGVGLFFVLSGFLIGRLVIDIVEMPPLFGNLRIFLVRRWMRTLPIYGVWLTISVIFFPPPDYTWWHFLTYLTFTQNLAWPMPPSNWFGVAWSLTVEEWFYLLFSIAAVLACYITRRARTLTVVIVVFLVIPPALRWQVSDTASWHEELGKVAIFRLDSMAYGVGLAWMYREWPGLFRWPRTCGIAGCAIMAVAWSIPSSGFAVPFPHAFRTFVFNIFDIGAVLCISGGIGWVSATGLIATLVRKASDISYCLYLTHLTILMSGFPWLAYGLGTVAVCTIALPIMLSLISWYYFESRILELRPRQIRD